MSIDELRSDEVFAAVRDLTERRLVLASVQPGRLAEIDLPASARVLETVPPTVAELTELARRTWGIGGDLRDVVAAVLPQTDGSFQDMFRAIRFLDWELRRASEPRPRRIDYILRIVTEIGVDLQRHVSELQAARLLGRAVIELAAVAPGIPHHVPSMASWLMDVDPSFGSDAAQTTVMHAVAEPGLALVSSSWVLVPERFATAVRAAATQPRETYVEMVTAIAAGNAGVDVRLQTLRGGVHYMEEELWRPDGSAATAGRLLGELGPELLLTGRRSQWLPLINAVLDRDDARTSNLLVVAGHAFRLSDDYDAARSAFQKAMEAATSDSERRNAAIGLLSADKNLGTASARRMDRAFREHDQLIPLIPRVGVLEAQAHFQQGNVLFSQSRWDDAADHYNAALASSPLAGPVAARVRLDILKGLGDIARHRDERAECIRLVTEMFETIADHDLAVVSRVGLAKSFQFAGDCCRRAAVEPTDLSDHLDQPSMQSADYWYRRSLIDYAEQGMDLGVEMTRYRVAQLLALAGESRDSLELHLEVRERMYGLRNTIGLLRSDVSVLLVAATIGDLGPIEAVSLEAIESHLQGAELSRFHSMWCSLAVHAVGSRPPAWDAWIRTAEGLGIGGLASLLRRRRIGRWMFAYY